jgi:hypothetical protein
MELTVNQLAAAHLNTVALKIQETEQELLRLNEVLEAGKLALDKETQHESHHGTNSDSV